MKKRVLTLVLALTLCLGLTGTGVLAYSDISDPEVLEAVEVLSGLGILEGNGDGSFQPSGTLTRGEFCKLAVLAEGHEDQIKGSSYRTLFSDVPATSWAAPYVNLIYEEGLMSGYGDGTFGPDDPVTVGQAVSAALGLLGYTATDIGPFWPEDYMDKAADLGLLDGVTQGADQSLTRGNAALLLYRLLYQTTKDGKDYIQALAAGTETGVVVLDRAAESDDGTLNTAKVYLESGGMRYYEQKLQIPAGLTGRRGTLLLDKSGKVCGFLPDDGIYKALTNVSATADGLKDADGKSYLVPSAAAVVMDDGKQTYGNCWYDLDGRDVTLYYAATGSIELVIAAESTAYEGVTLTGYYENAAPSAANPTTVTLFGVALPVADGVAVQLSQFKVGERMTVVLNAAGEVAAAYSTSERRADAIGVLESANTEKAQITLTSGLTVTGTLTNSTTAAAKLVGSLVTVSSSGMGKLTVSALTGRSTTAQLNVPAKTLGSLPLADRVKLYDRVGTGLVTEVDLDDILSDMVPAAQIEYYVTNAAGEVSLILMQNATGDAYAYGLLHAGTQEGGTNDMKYTNHTVSVENSSGTGQAYITGETVRDEAMGGVAGTGEGKTAGIVYLTKVADVARSDFDGTDYVVLDGVRVPVSGSVQVYNRQTGQWTTLSAAKAFSGSFTVYYSGTLGGDAKARVICAEG